MLLSKHMRTYWPFCSALCIVVLGYCIPIERPISLEEWVFGIALAMLGAFFSALATMRGNGWTRAVGFMLFALFLIMFVIAIRV